MTVEANDDSFDDMYAAAVAEVETATEDDALDDAGDAGPEDEDDEDAPEGDDDDHDESGELADEAGEESGGELEGDEEESDEPGDDQDEEDDESADQDTDKSELDELRALIATQGEELDELRTKASDPAPQKAQQPQRPRGPDPRLVAAVEAIYQGGDIKENLKGFDPAIQRAAVRHATSENARQARYGLDPHQAYADRIAPFVANHVAQLVEQRFRSLETVQQRRSTAELVSGFDNVLPTGGDKMEVARILRDELPPNDGQTSEQRMRIAVELYVARRDAKKFAKTKGRVEARERDQDSRKKARRETGGRRRKKRGRSKPPETDDIAVYAAWAAKHADQLGDEDFVGVE